MAAATDQPVDVPASSPGLAGRAAALARCLAPAGSGSGAAPARVIAVPLVQVRFLQALAEDGPGARPCRAEGPPDQQVVQRTLC